VREFGNLSLNATPTTSWVEKYPNGRIWYYRFAQYPVGGSGAALDVPSTVTAYVQAFAEGYVASRHAPNKAEDAYSRAKELFDPPSRGALVVDDNAQQTDWE
jgi:hypothetical protein